MKKKKMTNYNKIGWGFILSLLILWFFYTLVPFIYSFILSFQSCTGSVCEFTGLQNITKLLTDEVFLEALGNTLLFLVIQVPIMLIFALLLAYLLNNPKLKFKGLYRTAIFLPCVTSLVAYSVLFTMMFATNGIINDLLMGLHIITEPINWLADPFWSKVLIILALLWRWTGYNMIFYLAAMQNIPSEIYEAARIDGAGSVKIFFSVVIPQLKPVIFFTMVMSTIGTLQLFDEPMNITHGGPGYETTTISQHIYNTSFVNAPDMGYASTMSFVIVSIVVLLMIFQKRIIGEE